MKPENFSPLSILRSISLFTLILIGFFFSSCAKDDPAPSPPPPSGGSGNTALSTTTLQGSWQITAAEGTEWRKDSVDGNKYVQTPRATDSTTNGIIFTFTADSVFLSNGNTGRYAYTLNAPNNTILIGADANSGLGSYTITNFQSTSGMGMEQRTPLDVDFSYRANCDCYLSFQKFWTFTKQ